MIPTGTPKGTPIFHAERNCLEECDCEFHGFVPSGERYVRTTMGHVFSTDRCFLNRKDAVELCVRTLRKRIAELEASVTGCATVSRR